jgi:hypothetical protein
MRKKILFAYLAVTVAFGVTLSSWLTWGAACDVKADQVSDFCGRTDGVGYVGVFVLSLIAVAIYLGVSYLVLRLLKLRITRIED